MMTGCEGKHAAVQMLTAEARHEDALAALQQRVAENDDDALAHNDLGSMYYAAGQMDKALAHYQKAARLLPESPECLKNLADLLYCETDDAERALAIYDKILSIRPDDVETLMVAGHLEVTLDRLAAALGRYTRILEIEPANEEAKQFVHRIRSRKVAQETGQGLEADYTHCQELVAQGQTKEGIACLERLTQQQPDFALAHNDLGVLYYQQGDKARCLQCYKKAVLLDAGNPVFLKNLADFYLVEEGSVEKAMQIYATVLKDNPEDIDALMVAGHICSVLGKKGSARTFYERVLDIEPWNFDAIERMNQFSET